MMFIGKQIDLIPHTGIVLKRGDSPTEAHEFFYSGGIQVLHPHRVVEVFGLAPVDRVLLGRTGKSDGELRAHLRSIAHKYTVEKYNLFEHNCNNFSDEVSRFLLEGKGIPEYILRVPSEVQSTPMGATVAQMFGNMNARAGSAGGAFDPFAALAGGAGGEGGGSSPLAAIAAAAAAATSAGGAAGGAGAAATGSVNPAMEAALAAIDALKPAGTPLLDSHSKPLLSSEAGNVQALVDKLARVNAGLPDGSPHRLSAEETATMATLPALLASPPEAAATAGTDTARVAALLAKLHRSWPHASAAFALLGLLRLAVLRPDCAPHLLSGGPAGEAAAKAAGAASGAGASATAGAGVLWDVLETATAAPSVSLPGSPIKGVFHGPDAHAASAASASSGGMYGSHGANVMALSVLANLFATPAGTAWATHHSVLHRIIDMLSRVLAAPAGAAEVAAAVPLARPELRQMAAALAYNVCSAMPVGSDTLSSAVVSPVPAGAEGGAVAGGSVAAAGAGTPLPGAGVAGSTAAGDATVTVTDASVQLLGALLESVAAEADGETARRRLLAAGRLIQREGPAAGELLETLGMGEGVKAVAADRSRHGPVRALAREVASLITEEKATP